MGCSLINHPFLDTPIDGNPHMIIWNWSHGLKKSLEWFSHVCWTGVGHFYIQVCRMITRFFLGFTQNQTMNLMIVCKDDHGFYPKMVIIIIIPSYYPNYPKIVPSILSYLLTLITPPLLLPQPSPCRSFGPLVQVCSLSRHIFFWGIIVG